MHDVMAVAIKALPGGLLVAAFAIVGHVRPKWFAGLFGTASGDLPVVASRRLRPREVW
jgi:hypothetical protein